MVVKFIVFASVLLNVSFILLKFDFATTPNYNLIEKDPFLHRRTFSIATKYSEDYQLFVDNYYNKTNMKKVIYANHNSTSTITYDNAEMRYIDFSQKLKEYFSKETIYNLTNSQYYEHHLTEFLRTVIALETNMVYSDMNVYFNNNTMVIKNTEFITGLFKSDNDYEGIIDIISGYFYLQKETLLKIIQIQNNEYRADILSGAGNRFFHKYVNNVILLKTNNFVGCRKAYLEFPIMYIAKSQYQCFGKWNMNVK